MDATISTRTNRLRDRWLALSIKRRFLLFSIVTTGAAVLTILALYLGAVSLMRATDQILDSNQISLGFQTAMAQEQKCFTEWALGVKPEPLDDLTEAASLTEEAVRTLETLPEMVEPTDALMRQIWGIRNSYQLYARERDAFLSMSRSDDSFVPCLYRLYDMQDYLVQYGSQLTRIVMEQGDLVYQEKQNEYRYLPVAVTIYAIVTVAVLFLNRWSMDRLLIRPVIELAQDARKIAKRQFDGVLTPRRERDEMMELIEAFTRMKQGMAHYIETLKENSELQIQLEKMRLEILKSQINPHFLFNTLNTISCMAQMEGADTTDRMILSLSRLFQYSLKAEETVAPLRQEFRMIEDYLYLQKMRFGERIRATLSMASETAGVLVPSFMLQPLVENAIVHGIGKKEEGGRILVESRIENGRLRIRIEDNGVGMPPDVLEDVRAGRRRPASGHGVGLGNIQKRVSLMYEDGKVEVDSRQGEGTVIQISFTEHSAK
ncbi:MAG: sensor histidine kinase [Clostridiales bacterium]|nr:sensor histidine kinase [Clostridiales bacterium]